MTAPWTDATAHSPLNENGRWLLIQDSAGEGQLWDVSGRNARCVPLRLEQRITMIEVSPDTHRLALVGADETVRVWIKSWAAGWAIHCTPGPAFIVWCSVPIASGS